MLQVPGGRGAASEQEAQAAWQGRDGGQGRGPALSICGGEMRLRVDITGYKFNRLRVIRRAPNKGRYTQWLCICDCGNEVITGTNNLRQGMTNSCGCYKRDRIRETHALINPNQTFWNDRVLVLSPKVCWNWKGGVNSSGYGSFKGNQAHRFAYESKIGRIDEGLCVLHKCDNRRCCNPDHLFLGTYSDNFRDAFSKGRTFYQKHPEAYPRGENHANAVLTWPIVRAIRKKYATGKYRQIDLARMYNTTQAAVSQLTRNVAWREQE